MKRLLPYPAMTLFILVTWLILNQSIAVGHLLLGAIFGLALSGIFGRLQPPRLKIRNRRLLLRLVFRVAKDVIASNLAVLRVLLRVKPSEVKSGFVAIPLQLKDPYGLGVLACIITATPGTIWMSYRSSDGVLLIHVFDLIEDGIWIENITRRYERPLREIFE